MWVTSSHSRILSQFAGYPDLSPGPELDKKLCFCLRGAFGLNKFTFSHCSMLTTNAILKRYLSGENDLQIVKYNVF